jgi:HEAT repeats
MSVRGMNVREMSFKGEARKLLVTTLIAGLLATPAWARARQANLFATAAQEPDHATAQRSEQDRRDAERDTRDRAEEKRDREQEKKDQEQERLDQMQEIYDQGREALDDDKYQEAERKFAELAQLNGSQTDAALYWKAYAENRQGKRDTALATIAELKRRYPQSRWKKDGEALEIEVRQSSGHPVNPESQSNEELKTLALQGLMNSDPERGIQMIEKRLDSGASPKDKSKMLFVLAQNGSPKAQELLAKIAQGQSNPELQRKAVEYLGIFGGNHSSNLLATIYASSGDTAVKRAVIRSYMISGNKEGLFQLAKNEKDESLKRDAIRNLGLVGGQNELQLLYQTEPSSDIRREILQGFFLSGQSDKLAQVAQTDKDIELRRAAVRNLGLMGKSDVLQSIYGKETDRGMKEEVLNAYFISGNAKGLVAIAKAEKDPELKKRAVEKLSLMGSKEGSDYLMELLNK